jgi:TRAP-type C4-dicarboxylate transport system permease large subunit
MKSTRTIAGVVVAFAIPFLSGCWYAAAAGAGAAGGYELKKKGYDVQSPITKEKGKKESKDSKKDSEKSDTE